MPTKGYRKGISDTKEPLPRFVRTRLSEKEFQDLAADAASRATTISGLARTLLVAHLTGQRAALPHRNANAAVIRELARVGNNLNQLARQANSGMVPVPADDVRRALDTINTLTRNL